MVLISGVGREIAKGSVVGFVVEDWLRRMPVKLGGQFALPELVIVQFKVS